MSLNWLGGGHKSKDINIQDAREKGEDSSECLWLNGVGKTREEIMEYPCD